jgi:succinoglycan biosynthesis transport protein ExoP
VRAVKSIEAVRRHRWLVVGCLLLAVAAAGLASRLMTPVYSANAQIFVAARGESPYEGQLFSQQRVRSYADIVDSPPVMSAVIERLDLPITTDKLAAKVTTDVPPETVLISLTVKDSSPRLARAIANAAEFSRFATRIEQTDPDKPPPVTMNIVKPASLPTSPSSPRTLFNLSLGLVVGLFLGIGAALISETLHPSPRSEEISTPIPFGARRRSALRDAEDQGRDGTTDFQVHSIRRS